VRIVVIAPKEPAAFFDLLWQGVWEATFDIAQFGVEVADVTPPRHDLAAQRTILSGLLAEQVDAIAIVPLHTTALNDLIARHVARGTSVITFHADAPASGRTLFVGPDAFHSGTLAGELLAKLMGHRGQVWTFSGPRHEYHLAQRYDGLRAELERHPGMCEVASCPDREITPCFIDFMRRAKPIEGIYVGSEHIVEIASALQECNFRVPCVGFTNTDSVQPFVKSGVVSAIVDESRFQQGYFALQKAYEAAIGKGGPAPRGILIPCSVVLACNVDEVGDGQSLNEAFEGLIVQRTAGLITHQKMLQEANAKLEELAQTDPLTGLFNRRRFEEALRYEVDRACRYGTLSILMIDMNWFKQLNDQYGHKAGDEALKTVAQLLKTRCRTSDICARLGGDEFAVILPQTGADGAAIVRQSILDLIEQARLPWQGQELRLNLSIGAATLSTAINKPDDLMGAADAEMYRHKLELKAFREVSLPSPIWADLPA